MHSVLAGARLAGAEPTAGCASCASVCARLRARVCVFAPVRRFLCSSVRACVCVGCARVFACVFPRPALRALRFCAYLRVSYCARLRFASYSRVRVLRAAFGAKSK